MKSFFACLLCSLFFLPAAFAQKKSPILKKETKAAPAAVKFGKYGCSASKYVGGYYESQPRGSFVLAKTGAYTYYGFEKPSVGSFTVNAKGVISFKGGYLNGGEATPMEDRENRYYVVFPANPDNRWTCSWVGEK